MDIDSRDDVLDKGLDLESRVIDKHNAHDIRISQEIIAPLAHVAQEHNRMNGEISSETKEYLAGKAIDGFKDGVGNLGFDRNSVQDIRVDEQTREDIKNHKEVHGDELLGGISVDDPAQEKTALVALLQTPEGVPYTHVFGDNDFAPVN